MATGTREVLRREAARMFALAGYRGVSIEELGAAAGISGPGVYRHFPSKEALLADLLVSISTELLANGRAEVAAASGPRDALERLVDRHLAFTLTEPDLIRVQDRDLSSLGPASQKQVRTLQRRYVELWVDQLVPQLDRAEARARCHAAFGLMNSTPHLRAAAERAPLLKQMALAALRV